MELEWDEEKRQTTIRERGIDFAELESFFRSDLLEERDERHDYEEERIKATGMLYERVLVVVYTLRESAGTTKTRIISARKAELNEREEYHRQLFY